VAVFAGKFEKVAFIVSSGRTGTKALAQHLGTCYANVRACHEPTPSWRLRRASNKALCGHAGLDELTDLLARSRRRLARGIAEPIYVESNPYVSGFVEAIDRVFDRPLLIHVVRDPRTFVRSSINFGAFRGLKLLANHFVPYWMPKPEYFGRPCERRFRQMSPPERMAWYWNLVNRALNRGQEVYGDRYLRIRFEELFARDGTGMSLLTDWMGLPRNPKLIEAANSEQVNASRDRHFPRWPDWDESLKARLLEHCGELMALYGYAPEGEMRVSGGLAVSAAGGDNRRS